MITMLATTTVIEQLISADADLSGLLRKIDQACIDENIEEYNRSRIKTIASELGRNILKYADMGRAKVYFEQYKSAKHCYISFEDNGPGIANIKSAMADHFSTSGTLGLGLPGVERMADKFEINSEVGKGTNVTAMVIQARLEE